MEYIYTPVGVCSNQFLITMDGDIITSVKIRGGCPGNTLAVTTLVEGNNIHDVIKKEFGIKKAINIGINQLFIAYIISFITFNLVTVF